MFVYGPAGGQRFFITAVIPLDRQNIINTEVLQFDHKILGLFAGETTAEDMRDRVNIVLILNQGANTQGSGPFAFDLPLNAAGRFFVNHFRRVAGDIDKWCFVSGKIINDSQQAFYIAPPFGRDDFETY